MREILKKSEIFSLRKRLKSFRFAINGIKNLVKNEHNDRIHIATLICVIGLGIVFKIELTEWIAISIVSGLILLTELFNTAIERLAVFCRT